MASGSSNIPWNHVGPRTETRASATPSGPGGRARRPSLIAVAQLLVAAAIVFGWTSREERWLVPDRGAGYWLGPVGLGAMVLLLAYPLRKRLRPLRAVGRIGTWFQTHMLLGLVGPLAILYHANFRLGSANANIALASMLLVAGSGVVGRVLYVRIHAGLEGRRRTLEELRDEVESVRRAISGVPHGDDVVARLEGFEHRLLDARVGAPRRLARRLLAFWSGRRVLREVRRLAAVEASRSSSPKRIARATNRSARRYVQAVRRVAGFETWERLFALWHVAHLPLSFLLFAAAAIHVLAVHRY